MTTFDTRSGDPGSPRLGDATDASAPGWYDDPFRTHRLRYFSGSEWTDHVTHFGPTPCQGCG